MSYRIAADAVLVVHLLFILFVFAGGLLVLCRPWLMLVHLPAVAWGALLELQGWVCPLTPLELQFRLAAGEAGYSGGFIEHYLLALIYPDGLTRQTQLVLAGVVIVVNALLYGWLLYSQLSERRRRSGD